MGDMAAACLGVGLKRMAQTHRHLFQCSHIQMCWPLNSLLPMFPCNLCIRFVLSAIRHAVTKHIVRIARALTCTHPHGSCCADARERVHSLAWAAQRAPDCAGRPLCVLARLFRQTEAPGQL